MMRNGECGGEDVVFFEDMFQPGIESVVLHYVQSEEDPQFICAGYTGS